MTLPLPKWVMLRYSILWNKYKDKMFNHDQAATVLKDKEQLVSVFLSDLKKAGWLEITLSSEDSRKRVYRLKSPEHAVKEMSKS